MQNIRLLKSNGFISPGEWLKGEEFEIKCGRREQRSLVLRCFLGFGEKHNKICARTFLFRVLGKHYDYVHLLLFSNL